MSGCSAGGLAGLRDDARRVRAAAAVRRLDPAQIRIIISLHAPSLKPRVGALEIFRDLQRQGVAQAVVSNSDRLIVDANLRAVGMVEPGLKTVSRNDVREGKPDPEPFLRAAWLTGIDPAESFVMEDSFTGATAGLAAGMRTIFWPEAPMGGPPGALIADSADQVRSLLGL